MAAYQHSVRELRQKRPYAKGSGLYSYELEQGERIVLSGPLQSRYTFGIYAPSMESFHALPCVRTFLEVDPLDTPYRGMCNLDFDVDFDSFDFLSEP